MESRAKNVSGQGNDGEKGCPRTEKYKYTPAFSGDPEHPS